MSGQGYARENVAMSDRAMTDKDVLAVYDLHKHYPLPRESLFREAGRVYALNGVDLRLGAAGSLGIVGESGCGKSTLARLVMGLEVPTAGRVEILGRDIAAMQGAELRHHRRHFQMVFQDPFGSLDPRQKVGRIVAEPLHVLGGSDAAQRAEMVAAVLEQVGLRASDRDRYPHEFSGGQRQRIAVARALITRPALIVADEAVSALDVSVQAQVLNLLRDLQEEHGIAYLFISHDLGVVDYLCEEVAVMYLGRIVERAPAKALFAAPLHPYTRALLEAVPRPEPGRRARMVLGGSVPAQTGRGRGCVFAGRCPRAAARCRGEEPPLIGHGDGHFAACHFPGDFSG